MLGLNWLAVGVSVLGLNWLAVGVSVLGLNWLAVGVSVLGVVTRGFRRQPPEMDYVGSEDAILIAETH